MFSFYTQQNVNSAANFVFTSKTGHPRVVLVLRWALFVPEIFVSPLSEFEQHMYSSDPRPDTGSLMQLENRGAVPQASQPPQSKNLSQDILIFSQLDGREVKNHCRLRDHAHFFHFFVKALALQKRPLFVLFSLVGRTAAILDVAMLCAVEGAQCKTRELP